MTALYDIPIERADGSTTTLAEHTGKVMLIVNVASKCGLTTQYEGLEELHRSYGKDGLVVLGFPANDFANQEPGTNEEIQEFCRLTYGVDFPVFGKITVTGPDKHPLYKELTEEKQDAEFRPDSTLRDVLVARRGHVPARGEVTWNFEKFLVGRDGKVAERFGPDTVPQDERITGAIRELLAQPA